MTVGICNTCGGGGPFYTDRRAKSGMTSMCRTCINTRNKKYYAENTKKAFIRNAAWARTNSDRARELKANWASANTEKVAHKNAEYVRNNTEKVRATKLAWHKNNPEKSAQISRRYQAAKRSRLVSWADKQKIKEMYAEAAACGMHVDHIVPLHGKLVSGLHVHANLRLLSPIENRKKGNRFDVTQETAL